MPELPTIPKHCRKRLMWFGIGSLVLIAGFATTLAAWLRFCLQDDLFSHILLIPAVSGFLIVRRWRTLAWDYSPAWAIAAALGALAALFLLLSFRSPESAGLADPVMLSWRMLAFVFGWVAIAVGTLGGRLMSGVVFPAVFLLFMVPLPPEVVGIVERGLQHASAEVSAWLFPLVDVVFFRDGLSFQLPSITLEVAPECSGIRSTLVLFITSLVAGQLLLERPWQRAALALLVIPLGIFRNAVRIVTIGWLCTNYGPDMIHSPIHHRGGPVFFVVSLLPLFAMLWIFRKLGRSADPPER